MSGKIILPYYLIEGSDLSYRVLLLEVTLFEFDNFYLLYALNKIQSFLA